MGLEESYNIILISFLQIVIYWIVKSVEESQ